MSDHTITTKLQKPRPSNRAMSCDEWDNYRMFLRERLRDSAGAMAAALVSCGECEFTAMVYQYLVRTATDIRAIGSFQRRNYDPSKWMDDSRYPIEGYTDYETTYYTDPEVKRVLSTQRTRIDL